MGDWIGMAVIVVAAILVFIYMHRKKEKTETVQDVIGKSVEVSPKGIVRYKNMFRAVIEVQPIPMNTQSKLENDRVWINMRMLANTMGIPFTMVVQSQYIDMKDYTDWYEEQINKNTFLTPELIESGQDVKKHIHEMGEERNQRDQRCYFILWYDPLADNINSGVETGQQVLDDLLKKVTNRQNKMSEDEMVDLAEQVLDEQIHYIFQACEQWGMQYRLLDREGIYNYVYMMLNKELAAEVRLSDAVESESFTADIESLTKQVLRFEEEELKSDKEVS